MTEKTDMSKEREALEAYLKDCDKCQIVPDVGGAWHAAFQAGRASLPAAGQEPVAYAMFADGGNIRLWSEKPLAHPNAVPLYAAPQPAVAGGWVMVPIEPTEEMLANVDQEVGGHCHSCTKWRASYADCKAIWTDMLSALPPAPSTEGAQ